MSSILPKVTLLLHGRGRNWTDSLFSVSLHLITKQHSLKLHAGLHNNLLYTSSIEPIYYVSDDLSYFGGPIRIITTQGEDL